jgi:two-component system sensor histidine kinase BarA
MPQLGKAFYRDASFRRQLLTTFSIGLFALAVTASVTTAWYASKQAQALLVAQGLQVTGSLARQSVLALLYGSGDNAKDSVAATLSFPDVRQVAIFDRSGKPLLVRGEGMPSGLAESLAEGGEQPVLAQETSDAWHFAAPVYAHRKGSDEGESPFAGTPPQPEWLGYVCVGMGKDTLRAMQTSIFVNNIAISLGFALALIGLLNLGIRRLTRPLYNLAGVMQKAEEGEKGTYDTVGGPTEVAHMAQAFNSMMAALEERDRRLRERKEILESEVALRTHELVQARDAAIMASRHKSEFLANMSHELRTPMNAIIGYTEMVIEDLELEGREEMLQDLRRVLRAAQHLLDLINHILDLAKIEAGRMEIHLEATDLNAVVKQVAETIRPMMLKNRNHMEVAVEGASSELHVDSGKLLQILLNLLSNAAKFTHAGLVRVKLQVSDALLSIAVADNGIGMAPEQQTQIFEEFRQVDMSSTRNYEGTGLGLTITKRFCELLGGTIAVESEPAKGSTFTVHIPLPVQAGAPAGAGPPKGLAALKAPERQRSEEASSILLVDDDPAFLDILSRTLEQSGYEVHTARNANDALTLLRALHPLAVTLDLEMPDADGWSVLSEIKNDPALRNTPVIVISILDERTRGLGLGAYEFLTKPLERSRLLSAIKRISDSPH